MDDNNSPRPSPIEDAPTKPARPALPKDRNARARLKVRGKQADAKAAKIGTRIMSQINQLSGRREEMRDEMADKFLADGHVGGIPVTSREQAIAAAEIILTNASELPPVEGA